MTTNLTVAVADPTNASHFLKPNADGSLNVDITGGGGGAVTIADGADVTEGAIADAAATAGGTGTVSAKLRRISTQLPAALGSALSAASMPVVIASDQGALTVVQATAANLNAQVVGNVANGVSDAGNPLKMGGVGSSTGLTSVTNGQRANLWLALNGAVIIGAPNNSGVDAENNGLRAGVALSNTNTGYWGVWPMLYNGTTWDRARSGGVTGMAGVSIQASPSGGASFTHIAAGQATTTVKSGAGTLLAIVFNSVATASNVTTVYDNTAGSGTVIAVPQATLATQLQPLTFGPAGLAFATGLTIVTATANGADMTVVYK